MKKHANLKKYGIYPLLLVAVLVLITACVNETQNEENNGKTGTDSADTGKTGNSQIANPASVNCIENGGTLGIIDSPEGQIGICTLSDGTVCEEWSYFRGECGSKNTAECSDSCPMLSQPAPGFCTDGTIIDGGKNACGCQMPPKCEQTIVACTMDAKICPDGSAVGRVAPNCEFAACPGAIVQPPIDSEKNFCMPESRRGGVCTKEYMPVCGWFSESIKCFAYPCAQTFGNKCEACSNENVAYWTEGACPKTGSVP